MARYFHYFLFAICFVQTCIFAVTSAGTTSTTLDAALSVENVNGGVVNFDVGDVNLVEQVRAVQSDGTFTFVPNADITINGSNNSLNGQSTTRGFFVGGRTANATGSVTINDLIFSTCRAKGGNGRDAGGGGMGAGGGLFVGRNSNVIITNCVFSSCSAKGGDGLDSGGVERYGGGGGLRGDGGRSEGGGGGFGNSGDGLLGVGGGGGGASGFLAGLASGSIAGKDFDGGGISGGSGNGGDGNTPGTAGGFGGGGGGGFPGAIGGFGGGGGGGFDGMMGGFGGGGGGGDAAGAGGFGGGGGGGVPPSVGGFGGGDGTSIDPAEGGRGAGFGGAIFIEDGGILTIAGSVSFAGSSAAAGDIGGANTDPAAGFGALGQDIFMMSGSSLIFDITSNVTLSNAIEGDIGVGGGDPNANGLTKRGSALLSITGDNTYSGITTVEEGELRINSSVITPIVVEAGASLSGEFTAAANGSITNSGNLTNHGIVTPGVSGSGTIILEGEYTQTGSGILQVDITPNGLIHDRVMGATSANLAGTLEVIVNAGNYIEGTQYVIIDAPTGGTKFDSVVEVGDLGSMLSIQVDYSSVILTVLATRLFEDQTINPGPPSEVVKCIQEAVIIPNSDFAQVVEILGMVSDEQINEVLTSLSPVRFGALEWINARNNSYIAYLLSQHVFELCCSPRDCCSCDCNKTIWANGFFNIMNNRKSFDNLTPFNADAYGVLAGMDFCCSPCFYYGGAIGYTYTDFHWREQRGEGHSNSYYGALYGSWYCDCMSIDASVIGGGSDFDEKREIEFLTVNRNAKGDFWGYFFTGHLGGRYKWDARCCMLEPFALVDYNYFYRKGFKESGADSLNLDVESKTQHFLRGEAGLWGYCPYVTECFCFAPYIGISWVGEFPLHDSDQKASFQGQDCVMDVESYDSSAQLASPQGGIKWTTCNGFSFTAGYKGLFNREIQINQGEVRVEWVF